MNKVFGYASVFCFCCTISHTALSQESINTSITTSINSGKSSAMIERVEQRVVSNQEAVSVLTIPRQLGAQVQSLSGSPTTKRVLIRLKSPSTQVYFKQETTRLGKNRKLSPSDKKAILNSAKNYRLGLKKNQASLVDQLRNRGYLRKFHRQFLDLTNTINVSVPENLIDDIRQLPEVDEVFVDGTVYALLDKSVPVTEAPELWAMQDPQGNAITGRGVTVAVLDTGIDYTHPDLGGCVGANCKVIAGYNFVAGEDPANFMDKDGHGTHVAGIIAANGVLRGVAPDVKLYAYKVLNDNGHGSDSDIIAALEKAVDPDGNPNTADQINIVNMSLGGGGTPDSPLSEAANNAMSAGTLVVVAAGNSGSDFFTVGSPGNASKVLTVGATNNLGEIADFSSRGPVADKNYVKPEIVAPGVNINSTAPGAKYSVHSGTSMASPHVAGGAALLKQFFPQLSAAEIKDLLISSAGDLQKDIFEQGAGAMKLKTAVQTSVIISPRLLSVGRVDLNQSQFLKNVSFKVKNISKELQTISLLPPELLPDSIKLNIPTSTSMLAAGDSADFSLELNMDVNSLEFSDSGSLHQKILNRLVVNGNNMNLPLVFSKAAVLDINLTGNPYSLFLFNEDGSYSKEIRYSYGTCPSSPSPIQKAMAVKPGLYHMAVSFFDNKCLNINALVFKENILVDTKATVDVTAESAVNNLAIGDVRDRNGKLISPEEFTNLQGEIEWWRAGSGIGDQSISIGNIKSIKISNTSENIQLNSTILMKSPDSTSADMDYYLMQGQFLNGITGDKILNLDARDSAGVNLQYADLASLNNGVELVLGISQLRSISTPKRSVTSYKKIAGVLYDPVQINIYTDISTFFPGERYPIIEFKLASNSSELFKLGQYFSTGLMAFEDKSSFTKFLGFPSSREESLYKSTSKQLLVDEQGFFFAGKLHYSPDRKKVDLIDIGGLSKSHQLVRDSQQNIFSNKKTYQYLCGGIELNSGTINSLDGYDGDFDVKDCSNPSWKFNFSTQFNAKPYQSSVTYSFDPKMLANNVYLASPELRQLMLLNDGLVSRKLNGIDLELRINAREGGWSGAPLPAYSLIEYRLDSAGDWLALLGRIQNDEIVAKLPDIAGTHLLSLRITLRTGAGSTMIQELNGVALIGNDLEPAPKFDLLPALIFEATAPLTEVSLPEVFAKDAKAQPIAASTSNLGPFSLGNYEIRWQAKNSVGKISEAIQFLSIRDTTPPSVTPPADVRVTASSSLTAVALGQATAIDLVDGNIMAIANNNGPFAVGTHIISWTAKDKSGNTATTTQQLIVDPQAQVSSSSNQASGGSGGSSGGSIGINKIDFLLFLAFAIMFLGRKRSIRCT